MYLVLRLVFNYSHANTSVVIIVISMLLLLSCLNCFSFHFQLLALLSLSQQVCCVFLF